MSRSGRKKDRCSSSNEDTAARTRPFSFEEIMHGRKNKKLTGESKAGTEEIKNLSGKDNTKSASDHSDLDNGYKRRNYSILGTQKQVLEDTVKGISRKKEENPSKKGSDLLKDKRNHYLESNIKGRSNKEKRSREKGDKNEKHSHHRSKVDDRFRDDVDIQSEKKMSKESVARDKYEDRDKRSERESKRKYHGGNDEKSRSEIEVSTLKKPSLGKWQDAEYSDRKGRKEYAQSHYEEARAKRRRSRSREYDRDRSRRSISISPKPHKRGAYHRLEHGESSFHSSKDRSGRQHSDTDKSRMSSHGGHTGGHYRRHGGYSSGLGGYSPRKRRTEAAVRTPSPTTRSPERKSAAWDLPPTGKESNGAGPLLASFQSSHPPVSLNTHELPTADPVTSDTAKSQSAGSPVVKDISIDSIQLTEATRPRRRLYVENIPVFVSDKAVMECLNDFLLSSSVNHGGIRPCISCIINKETGQALVEFLTPEYATRALAFNGRSFSGSILKIRRPRDFIETATGNPEKHVEGTVALSDIVEDSPHKIFIGGISKALTSDMLLEIVSAFGVLRAYRFETSKELDEPIAFLEYADHSITLKACAGLNGMKLSGNVLTVVQAIPDEPEEEATERPPFYGIPDHARSLLEKPTRVLKLENVFKLEELSLLSEPELEETLEDVRLECARFGTVKSVNFVRYNSNHVLVPEEYDIANSSSIQVALQDPQVEADKTEQMEEHINCESKGNEEPQPLNAGEPKDISKIMDVAESKDIRQVVDVGELKDIGEVAGVGEPKDVEEVTGSEGSKDIHEVMGSGETENVGNVMGIREPPDEGHVTVAEEPHDVKEIKEDIRGDDDKSINKLENNGTGESSQLDSNGAPKEQTHVDATGDQLSQHSDCGSWAADSDLENGSTQRSQKVEKSDGELLGTSTRLNEITTENVNADNKNGSQQKYDLGVFEQGCILVEYVRKEAACMAAHCLHGRHYGDRIVAAGYVPYDLYQLRFPR